MQAISMGGAHKLCTTCGQGVRSMDVARAKYVHNMYGICMAYPWNANGVYGMQMKQERNMYEKWTLCAWNKYYIWDVYATVRPYVWSAYGRRLQYVWHVIGRRMEHVWSMYGVRMNIYWICMEYAQHTRRICMQHVCIVYGIQHGTRVEQVRMHDFIHLHHIPWLPRPNLLPLKRVPLKGTSVLV